MKILHTSDWHLGMSAGQLSYETEQRHFFSQLYDIIKKENINAVICAGDIYDNSVSNAWAIKLYDEAVSKICISLGCKLIVIAGNHDGAERLSSCADLLKTAGLYVFGRIQKEITPLRFPDCDIYPIPFFNKDEVTALHPEQKEQIKSDEQAMKFVCDSIRSRMDKSRRNIIVSHSFVTGASLSDSDRAAKVGFASAVSKEVFAGFDYVALGHIHKPQHIAENIVYSGSPIKYSFGTEEAQEKSVVIVDTANMAQKRIPLFPLHERRTVTGTFNSVISRDDLQNDFLKLRITDRFTSLELINELREKFPHLLEVNGKDSEAVSSASSLTLEEVETLDDLEIMNRFFEEIYHCSPSREQQNLFKTSLKSAKEEVLQ